MRDTDKSKTERKDNKYEARKSNKKGYRERKK